MRIGIDIDDTMADLYEIAFAYAQHYTINELGRSGKIQKVTAKHHDYLNSMYNWSHEEEMNFWHKYYKEIVENERPFTFAVETIKKLKQDGHEIIIITARWPEDNFDVNETTIKWFKDNDIQYDDIVFAASDKAKVAMKKKIDVFIDDSFKNCTEVANAGIKTFIMNTRTNGDLEAKNVTRVYSWPDFYNKIKFLK